MTTKGTNGIIKVKHEDFFVIVDIQKDFCPEGALAVPGGDDIVPIVNQIAKLFDHVVMTQDWHPLGHSSFASSHPGKNPYDTIELSYGTQILWPDHCLQGTAGAEFHKDLDIPHCQLITRKGFHKEIDSYSAFWENDHQTPTGLSGYLREIGRFGRLFMAGLATDFCVLYSALDARGLGFDAFVIEDACRGIDVDGSLGAAFNKMAEAGVIRVQSADLSKE